MLRSVGLPHMRGFVTQRDAVVSDYFAELPASG
jgi:hypothetical protein